MKIILMLSLLMVSQVTSAPASTVTFVGAGDIADNGGQQMATAALLAAIPGTVFTLGDNAYPDGTDSDYTNWYAPSWGQYKARTRPSPGNHDYHTAGAAGYFNYFGALAGPAGRGYYSYDVGDWHIISLDSEIDMSAGSAQEQWLRADLAANFKEGTLAYWHRPRFSSGTVHGSATDTQPLWQALQDYGADIVLCGHVHNYERFAPQNANGVADPARGIREFVVGTGGALLYPSGTPIANSEVRNGVTNGVLKLTLGMGTYSWQFIPIAGQTFTDSGSAVCHNVLRCQMFPTNNIWNTDISTLPVHAMSAGWVSTIGANKNLYVGFYPVTFGMRPVLTGAATPNVSITFGQIPSQSDPGPYPFGALTPLEVGTIDRRAFMIDTSTCTLYELYNANWNGGNPTADAGVVFPLNSNALRPDGWPSAGDAGLPIFPGLTRWDEVQKGAIQHALYFEAATNHVTNVSGTHLWPARHDVQVDGGVPDATFPPMGARFRLKSTYDIATFSADAQVILRALQHYGMFLADIGLDWELIGTADPNWDPNLLSELQTVPANQFEVVDESSLLIDPNSAQARQPGGSDTTPPATITDLRVGR